MKLNGKDIYLSLLKGKSFEHKGDFDATAVYYNTNTLIDCVFYDGTSYYCKKTTTAGILPTNTEYWGKMVEKGNSGEKGEKGENGASAGFGTPTATIDNNTGTASVTVTASGEDTAKVFNFEFHNLKGEKGDKGEKGEDGEGSITLAQETGQSTTEGMSQKAITDELEKRSLQKFIRTKTDGSVQTNVIDINSILGCSFGTKEEDADGNLKTNAGVMAIGDILQMLAQNNNSTKAAQIVVSTNEDNPNITIETNAGAIILSAASDDDKVYAMQIGGEVGIGFVVNDKNVFLPEKDGTLEVSQVQETLTIADISWQELSDNDPFKYCATATATTTINTNSEIELINNQAVLFANYGFSIAQVSEQTITIYAIDKPTSAVDLLIGIRG